MLGFLRPLLFVFRVLSARVKVSARFILCVISIMARVIFILLLFFRL